MFLATPNPERDARLAALVQRARAAYDAMSPVDRAMHDAEQRRSFIRGQCGRDPGPDVLVEEIKRLRALLKATDNQQSREGAL